MKQRGAMSAEWQARLEAQALSGLTISGWCKREKVSKSCFYAWRQRLSKEVNAEKAVPQLIAMPLSLGELALPLELSTPSGYVIRLNQGSHVNMLPAVLKALA